MSIIDILTLAGSVVGGIVASLMAIIIWEWARQPKLVIEIPDKVSGKEPAIQQLNKKSRALYHLTVVNKGKTPAYNCRITMKFKDVNTGKQLFTVSGKWDKGPQPLLYAPVPIRILPFRRIKTVMGVIPHDFLIPFAEVLDIYPNTPESFCIIVKYDDKKECYAFSSWSYLKGKGFKVKEWKLNIGEYVVEIELTYSGKKIVEKVHLVNSDKAMDSVKVFKISGQKG